MALSNLQKAQLKQQIVPACKDIAQRMVAAEKSFVESLMYFGEISEDDAYKAMDVMFKVKACKRNGIDRIDVKHGAYLDKEAIRNAVKIANGEL